MLTKQRRSQSVVQCRRGAAQLLSILAISACAAAPFYEVRGSQTPHTTTGHTFVAMDVDGLGLLREERLVAQQILASWAQTRGFRAADPELVERMLQSASAGRNVKTGELCGRPLGTWEIKKRYRRELGVDADMHAYVDCERKKGTCQLHVSIYPGFNSDLEPLLSEAAPYDIHLPFADALKKALDSLKPPLPDSDDGGMGALLGSIETGKVQARPEQFEVRVSPALASEQSKSEAFKGALEFPGGLAPAHACFGAHGGDVDSLAVVDKEGRITRCESMESEDPLNLCWCQAVMKFARIKAAVRDTRLLLGARMQPADVLTPWNAVVSSSTRTHIIQYKDAQGEWRFRPQVTDPSIEGYRPPPEHALNSCFADVAQRGKLSAFVTTSFDSQGKATAVAVRESGKGILSNQQRSCVEQAFLSSQAPCPAVQQTTSRVEFWVTVRPIGEDLDNPFK